MAAKFISGFLVLCFLFYLWFILEVIHDQKIMDVTGLYSSRIKNEVIKKLSPKGGKSALLVGHSKFLGLSSGDKRESCAIADGFVNDHLASGETFFYVGHQAINNEVVILGGAKLPVIVLSSLLKIPQRVDFSMELDILYETAFFTKSATVKTIWMRCDDSWIIFPVKEETVNG